MPDKNKTQADSSMRLDQLISQMEALSEDCLHGGDWYFLKAGCPTLPRILNELKRNTPLALRKDFQYSLKYCEQAFLTAKELISYLRNTLQQGIDYNENLACLEAIADYKEEYYSSIRKAVKYLRRLLNLKRHAKQRKGGI